MIRYKCLECGTILDNPYGDCPRGKKTVCPTSEIEDERSNEDHDRNTSHLTTNVILSSSLSESEDCKSDSDQSQSFSSDYYSSSSSSSGSDGGGGGGD